MAPEHRLADSMGFGSASSFDLDGEQLRGEMEYVVADEILVHAFEALLATEAQIDSDLEAAGLRRHRYLDDAGSWIEAVPLATA